MNVFQLQYHRCSVLVATLIGLPTIGSLLMLVILFSFPIHTPLWLICILIFCALTLMILLLKWLIKSQIFVPCTVNVNHQGIGFEINKANLFYKKSNFYSTWENVSSIGEKFNIQNGNYSYALAFKAPQLKANFSIMEHHEDEAEKFFQTLRFYQEKIVRIESTRNLPQKLPLQNNVITN